MVSGFQQHGRTPSCSFFSPSSSRPSISGSSNFRLARTTTTSTNQRYMSTTTSASLPEYGTPTYGLTKKVTGKDFDTVIDCVTAELKKYGFGVLTKIDMKETMQKKIGVEYDRPYVILGACNPKLANMALQSQPSIGLFLPCNVAVSQDPDDSIVVSVISPKVMFSVVEDSDGSAVAELADDVQVTMAKVIDAL